MTTVEGSGNVDRKEKINNNTSTTGVEGEPKSTVEQPNASDGGIGGSVEPNPGYGMETAVSNDHEITSTASTNTSSHATTESNAHAHGSEDIADIRTLTTAAKNCRDNTTGNTSMNLSKALRYAFCYIP